MDTYQYFKYYVKWFFTIKMNWEDFQKLDNEPFDDSIIKRDYLKVYHQQGALLNQSDQNIDFIFGENINYHQIGNAYLKFDVTVRKDDDTIFQYDDAIHLVKTAFPFSFKETGLSTTTGSDFKHKNF